MTARISWTQVALSLLDTLSERSADEKLKVAAVIFSRESKTPISFGYNGSSPGASNTRESFEVGRSGFLHAEENALLAAQSRFVLGEDHILFCSSEPCDLCAKRIIRSNKLHPLSKITRVVFRKTYYDPFRRENNLPRGSDLLIYAGIQVVYLGEQFENTPQKILDDKCFD